MIKLQESIRSAVGPMLDAMPHPVFMVDRDVRIVGLNEASLKMIGLDPEFIIRRRAGDILHCIHSKETEEGCGRAFHCSDCLVRNSVVNAIKKQETIKQNVKMELVAKGTIENIYMSFIASPFQHNGKQFALLNIENITELMELRELIPICSICHKVRNDSEYWNSVEDYIYKHLDLRFTHSLCPECAKEHYPGYS